MHGILHCTTREAGESSCRFSVEYVTTARQPSTIAAKSIIAAMMA
jgi:hypothetical protein